MKRTISSIILCLSIILTVFTIVEIDNVSAETIIVPDDYPTIRQAIDAASPGDTVYVRAGTYYGRFSVDKSINLTGEDKDTTIIDGKGTSESVIRVRANWANITGFTVTNGYYGISIGGYKCGYNNTITKNNICSNDWGIGTGKKNIISNNNIYSNNKGGIVIGYSSIIANNRIYSNSHNGGEIWGLSNLIFNNSIFSNNDLGLKVRRSCNHNDIINNNISSNSAGGIDLSVSWYNNITNNIISNNGGNTTIEYGHGISGLYTSYNNIINNIIISNEKYGIILSGISNTRNNNIIGNMISDNQWGISIWNSRNRVINNIFFSNAQYGLITFIGNTIYHNCFIENNGGGIQAFGGPNYWNDTYPSGGNYWSDWTTPDIKSGPRQDQPGSDGIVDVPYSIDGGGKDYYPFVRPLPDLEVKNSDIIFTPPSPVSNGTVVTINATIHNLGCGNATNVTVRFYDGTPSTGNQIGSDQVVPFIERFNGIGYAEVQWTATPIGTHNIYVVVDPDDTIVEKREFNNNASKAIEVIAPSSPRGLKLEAIEDLEAAKTGDKKIDKKIDKAIKYIGKSLKDKYWEDDTHLDPKHGKKVFYYEKKAVKYLLKVIKDKKAPDSVKDVCREVIDKLVTADKMLAEQALEDAKEYEGEDKKVDKEIERAEKELEKAEKDLGKGKPDKAIDHYKKAWEHAQKAIKHAKK